MSILFKTKKVFFKTNLLSIKVATKYFPNPLKFLNIYAIIENSKKIKSRLRVR